MKLTDNEIRDITKYLEAGKPLPEKYRFLLFEEKREVELVWNEKTNEVCNVVLPFQIIEQIDEPREEKVSKVQLGLFDVDNRGRQLKGWTNKLIWGDNKLILSSLKNGPMREEIEKQGGLKLIYIDPPFDVGADFSMDITIGGDTFTKKPSVLEELAYRDTWGKGQDSFITMIYERLSLMRDLLSDDGSLYVHCDWRVSGHIRLVLDEVFGKENFLNEIIWCYQERERKLNFYNPKHDTIFFYAKNKNSTLRPFNWEEAATEYSEVTRSKFKFDDNDGKGPYQIRGRNLQGSPVQAADGLSHEHEKLYPELTYRDYLESRSGVAPRDWWNIGIINKASDERLYYPTQKPMALIRQIIAVSSNTGDLVADFFCGSGTTLAVAEQLGRKWIGTDLGKFGIHTTRKRMIGVQRELKKNKQDYRAFEILNLGKYERQHYIGVNPNLRDEAKQRQLKQKEENFLDLILLAYKAEKVEGFKTFQGKKQNRLVAVGPINLPVTRLYVEELILECRQKYITKADVLAFEFEMGLFPNILDEAKGKGLDLAMKYIPRDVFDKRAIEKSQVVFHDVSYIEVKPHFKKNSIAVELMDFSVFYNQDSIANVEAQLKNGGNKIVIENGQIIKVSKDKNGVVTRERLTKKWTDWLDYWSVDFDFESKREIIRVPKKQPSQQRIDGSTEPAQLGLIDYDEVWTGEYVFENEWQSFRTKKDRKLQLTSIFKEVLPGRRKIAIKVVDIFGNDTMKIIEVTVGGK